MDAHVFRHIGALLAESLSGARLERIHEPIPGVTSFSLYVSGRKRCLLFRKHRSVPFLFLTDKSPLQNPAIPPAGIMRLRKYAEGRILGEAHCNWVGRQLAFSLPGPERQKNIWLLLDSKHGPSIVENLPPDFSASPVWPPTTNIPTLLSPSGDGSPAPWEKYQVLTPLLRRTLILLDPLEAAALLVDLEEGQGDLFWYTPINLEGGPPQLVSAWPLPSGIEERTIFFETATPATAKTVMPLLEAMQMPLLLAEAGKLATASTVKQDKFASKKRARLLAKLGTEKLRLKGLLALGDDARLLQANLWRLQPDERLESVSLPLNHGQSQGENKAVPLNSLISVKENMQVMFRKSAKAARGLDMLEKRLALIAEMLTVHNKPEKPIVKEHEHKKAQKKTAFSPSMIQEFRSSDGFVLWRGRSAEGNRLLLKLASPFDLWLHVEDGPSAHLLIRRDHGAQDIPEQTLLEAAVLVGLKSWRRDDPKAPIMVALAKHVQPIKGAGPGTVRVQECIRTLFVSLDETLERMLKRQEPKERKP